MISCRPNYLTLGIAIALTLGTYARHTEHGTRTTSVAAAVITTAPEVDLHAVLRRGNVATCGYVSGNAASPLTCPSAYSCTSTILLFAAWACCDQIQCQGDYRLCVDHGADDPCLGLDKDTCSSIYTSILTCSSAAPSCMSYARSKSLEDTDIRYSFGCGQTSGSVLALATPVNGKVNDEKVTSGAATSNTDSSPTGAANSNNNNANTNTNTNNNTPASKSSRLSPGEIAGIAIPSVAMIAAIIVAWMKPQQFLWCITCGLCGSHAPYGPLKQQPEHVPPQVFSPPPAYTAQPGLYNNQGFAGAQYGGGQGRY